MTKYEKRAWAMGIYASLCAVLFYFYLTYFDEILFRLPLIIVLMYGLSLIYRLGYPREDYTTMEVLICHKATAWTFYGMAAIVFALMCFFFPKESLLVSRNAIGFAMLYAFFIFIGIRYVLLACLLRKERLANAKKPHPPCPINTALPEGEGM